MWQRFIVQLMLVTFPYIVLAQSQGPLRLPAVRTQQKIRIDGLLNEPAWKEAAVMNNLIEFRPKIGAPEDIANRTETYLMYDDEGIYFGGYCHERNRDSIISELRGRDGFGANDYIGIIFDTYHDKINAFEYFVTPLNEQWDAKMAPPQQNSDNNNGGEDFTWNSVWKSGAVIHEDGWSFEMFIPYSAIRFGPKAVQDWGLNITRRRRSSDQQYTWNPIDPNKNGFLTQEGIWTGITNIKPPLRLQFSPYFSVYANHFPSQQVGQKSWTSQINGGMDVKYGINQAFTLDATLIPDFGQVQSDNQVLNLTPFEIKFNENRSFFTEGTELFSKGNLFYSRRIGGTPLHYYDTYDKRKTEESVLRNPTESKLLNASKVSGRTQQGLGIGVLNAITRTQYATIENSATKEQYKEETDPLTNYNIIVLDQTLKHNSSVSLINTNVWRSGKDYDANVTAALFDFNDKKNNWNLNGKLARSVLFGKEAVGKNTSGMSHQLSFGKTSGRFNFNIWQELTDTRYSHNDMGYFTNNNYIDHGLYVGYKWTEPRGWYNRIFLNFNTNISVLHSVIKPLAPHYQRSNFNFNINVQTKKLIWIGGVLIFSPYQNDFYEPRREGYFFRRNASAAIGGWVESNSSKRYSFYAETFARKFFDFYHLVGVDFTLNQTFRINSKLSLSHKLSLMPRVNSVGYAWSDNSTIVFGRRQVKTVENILSCKYNFNNKMGLTFRVRHYQSAVDNKEFYDLEQPTGKLVSHPNFNEPVNLNVNFFNIDMVYTWQFAPGSFMNVVWKDASYTYQNLLQTGYFNNVKNTLDADQNNNISVKVIYFLDYISLKHHRKA